MASNPDVKPLLLQLDATYELMRRNLNAAASELDRFARNGEQQLQRYDRAVARATVSSGQLRAAQQQLGFQISDVSASLASGTPALTVFAQQSGQVIQSIGLMTNSTSGFIGFLSGPWGAALTAAVVLLGNFAAKMFDTAEAAKAAELGVDSLAQVQGILGQVFDATSGRIKTQNELLLVNARLTAANLRADAQARLASVDNAERGARVAALNSGGGTGAAAGRVLGLITGQDLTSPTTVSRLIADVRSGALPAERALRFAETVDLRGSGLSRAELFGAIRDVVQAQSSLTVANELSESLRTGQLTPALRGANGGARPRGGAARRAGAATASARLSPAEERLRALDDMRIPTAAELIPDRSLVSAERLAELSAGIKDAFEQTSRIDLSSVITVEALEQAERAVFGIEQAAETAVQSLLGMNNLGFDGLLNQLKNIALQLLVVEPLVASIRGALGSGGGGIGTIFKGIGSLFGIPGRAAGGPVSAGRPYIVGERGPELFVPRLAGNVVANGAGGRQTIIVQVQASELFDARVSQVAGGVADSRIREAAPTIVEQSARSTMSALRRPGLNR